MSKITNVQSFIKIVKSVLGSRDLGIDFFNASFTKNVNVLTSELMSLQVSVVVGADGGYCNLNLRSTVCAKPGEVYATSSASVGRKGSLAIASFTGKSSVEGALDRIMAETLANTETFNTIETEIKKRARLRKTMKEEIHGKSAGGAGEVAQDGAGVVAQEGGA